MDHIIPRVEAVLDQIKPAIATSEGIAALLNQMKPAITAFESAAMMLIFWFIIILVIPFIGLHEFVKHYHLMTLTLMMSNSATLLRPLEKTTRGREEPNKDDKVDGPGAGEGSGDDLEPPQDNDNHSQNGGGEGGGDGADGRDGQEPNGNGGGGGGGRDEVNGRGGQEPNGNGGTQDPGDEDGGGGGGRGDPTTVDDDWESPIHTTVIDLNLKTNSAKKYQVTICYDFKFIVYHNTAMPIQLPLEHPLSQPKVTAAIDVEIETQPRQTKVDRSYASIGFVVHQNKSITRRKFFDRGFAEPLQTLKHIERQENQSGLHLTGGYSRGFTLTGGGSFNHTKGINFEATDSKPMAACYVEEGVGLKWNSEEENKSYTSYDVTYLTSTSPLTVKSPKNLPFRAQVGMGISIPAATFRGRFMELWWCSVVFFDDIKEKEPLVIYEDATIQLGSLEEPQGKLFLVDATSQDHNVTKNEWREVLWPELDKEFGKPDPSKKGKEPFWSIKCPAREAKERAAKEAKRPLQQ
ncbi:hypothetical protein B0H14DRAFT_3731733 [Mycena olivaceomarginata]|nr:hypothetical protein B0H14DRAFT_3731733 [Mycena olivaceomarginata]